MTVNRRSCLAWCLGSTLSTATGQAAAGWPPEAGTWVEHGVLEQPCNSRPGKLSLPYQWHRRAGSHRPCVVFLGGGPGVSNLGFTPPAAWLDLADVLVPEYRGVGQARPLLQSPHFMQALLQPFLSLSLEGSCALRPALAQGFADLRAQGMDFNDFGLGPMADDMDALCRQLGLHSVVLVAHSFGTRIAQAMQTRHRARVQGSLLLSPNAAPGGLIWFPQDTQSVWRRWSAADAQAGPLEPLLEEGWQRPGPWAPADSRALMMAFFMSFNQGTRERALCSLRAARDGASMSWWLMARSYPLFVRFGFNWADFFIKGYRIDGDPDLVAQADLQGRGALFQSPSSVLFAGLPGYAAAGGEREIPPLPDLHRSLAVIGEFDPSTPLERWPGALPESARIVLPRGGHAQTLHAARTHGTDWLRFCLAPDHP
jgi:pimeloyl-ACP methyl ester carboxylesterase